MDMHIILNIEKAAIFVSLLFAGMNISIHEFYVYVSASLYTSENFSVVAIGKCCMLRFSDLYIIIRWKCKFQKRKPTFISPVLYNISERSFNILMLTCRVQTMWKDDVSIRVHINFVSMYITFCTIQIHNTTQLKQSVCTYMTI